jgi:hypothetical protein
MRRFIGVGAAAILLLAACSSSSHKAAVDVPPTTAHVTTTTQGNVAIGLRTNADEQNESIPDKPLSNATRDTLAAELVAARSVAMQYPTVADAKKAGFILAGKFTPGAGAHYISISNSAGAFTGGDGNTDLAADKPLAYIYAGTARTSRIVGLMYGAFTSDAPTGFAGPNDHWHRHRNLCITFGNGKIGIPFPPDTNVLKSQCDKVNGRFMRETLWMVHAWVVPGWESPQGVFSHANVDLHCGDGTDHVDNVGFCTGSA